MGQSERNQNTRTEAFSLTVDQYGRLWLHAKLEGIEKISMVRFGAGDVVRHPLVGRIVEAYEGPDKAQASP